MFAGHSTQDFQALADPDPILLHLATMFCTDRDLASCSTVCDGWRAHLSWILRNTASLPIPCQPWLSNDVRSQEKSMALTRSWTIWEALRRHGIVASPQRSSQDRSALESAKDDGLGCSAFLSKKVIVHSVGTDAMEGDTLASTVKVFSPLCSMLRDAGISELTVLLNGMEMVIPKEVMLSSSLSTSASWSGGECEGVLLSFIWRIGMYTEELIGDLDTPDLVVCFNAGLWGYDTWRDTVAYVMSNATPLVITSYTWKEADDDEVVMEEVMMRCCGRLAGDGEMVQWMWPAERNPYGSTKKLKSYHLGEYLRDNSWWMSTK